MYLEVLYLEKSDKVLYLEASKPTSDLIDNPASCHVLRTKRVSCVLTPSGKTTLNLISD